MCVRCLVSFILRKCIKVYNKINNYYYTYNQINLPPLRIFQIINFYNIYKKKKRDKTLPLTFHL